MVIWEVSRIFPIVVWLPTASIAGMLEPETDGVKRGRGQILQRLTRPRARQRMSSVQLLDQRLT